MNKINKSILFFKLCVSTIFTINLSASVKHCVEFQANTCKECFDQLKEIADKDTLVVIDCNDVLISCDRLFYYKY